MIVKYHFGVIFTLWDSALNTATSIGGFWVGFFGLQTM